jgi:hypothetical protein
MELVLDTELQKFLNQKHNKNIVDYLESKGMTLEQAFTLLAEEISLKYGISISSANCVVLYDIGYTLDFFSNFMVDNLSINIRLLLTYFESDELDYQIEELKNKN